MKGYRQRTMGGLLLAIMMNPSLAGSVEPYRLRVEFLENPLAVEDLSPRFSWVCKSTRRGARPTAYRILVAASGKDLESDSGTLWDSGKQRWEGTPMVEFGGEKLHSRQVAYWKVRVWDEKDLPSEWSKPAQFAMGLLNESDWKAKWITNSIRPMPAVPGHNGFHSALSRRGDVEQWVAIDLGAAQEVDSVTLFPADPYDWRERVPGFLFPLRFKIELALRSDFGDAVTVVNHLAEDFPNPKSEPVKFEFARHPARYVRLVVSKSAMRDESNYGFCLAEMQVSSGRANLALGAKVTASEWIQGNDWSLENLTDGDLVSHPPGALNALPATHFRNEFETKQKPVRAILYASARGAYQAFINGKRVGNQELSPEWTDYFSRIQYQTYDVTDLLQSGRNAIAALVGDGWYAGRLGMSQALHPKHLVRGIYGRTTEFIAQLELQFGDGSSQIVATNEDWKCTNDGPVRSSDLLDGEAYDARKEMPNWSAPGFTATGWNGVFASAISIPLVSQPNEPIRISHTLVPISVTEPKRGVFVFDLGQNMPGVARLTAKCPPGAEVTLRYAEMLNDDGTVYVDNLRGAPQVDKFIAAGRPEPERFQPHFTYHGFRYVQVEGLESPPKKTALVGVVFHSDPEMVSEFECSDPMLNRLWKNVVWTQRANMMSAPTDCPQRDERLGWMGDIMVFGETATLNMEMAGFYKKWIVDVRDAQADDGRYPDFAPHPYGKNDRFNGVPGWGDAGVVVPWVQYESYGDARLIKQHFESAKRWVDWIRANNPDLIWRNARHNDYGDWLNGDTLRVAGFPERGSECPKDVFGTLVFIHSLDIVSKMAEVADDARSAAFYSELAHQARERFRIEFVDAEGKIKGDTQAGYALALGWKVLPAATEKRLVENLVQAVARCDGRMSTGFHSTLHLLNSLYEHGHPDLAMSLLESKRFPSWGFMIENGATTMWERWDGYVKGRGFQDPGMNSFNHWAFGAVGEFIFARIAGIARAESNVGWKEIIIEPDLVNSKLSWSKAKFLSPAGAVSVNWRRDEKMAEIEVGVPPGVSATVALQTRRVGTILESGKPLEEVKDISIQTEDDGAVRVRIGSGKFKFRFEMVR